MPLGAMDEERPRSGGCLLDGLGDGDHFDGRGVQHRQASVVGLTQSRRFLELARQVEHSVNVPRDLAVQEPPTDDQPLVDTLPCGLLAQFA